MMKARSAVFLFWLCTLLARVAWAQPEAENALPQSRPGGSSAPLGPAAPDARIVQWQADLTAAQDATNSRQFEQAEQLFGKALQEAEKLPPAASFTPPLTTTLQAFGGFYMFQGKFSKAEPLFRRLIKVCEQDNGKGSIQAQNARQSFATTYIMMGHYKSAESIAKKMVRIAEHNPPAGYDPLLSQELDFLASIYYSQQKFKKAEPLYKRALALDEKLIGPNWFAITVRLEHLAVCYRAQGRFDKAEPLFRRELDLEEMQHGKDSPVILGTLNQLADLMRKMGRQEEAAQFQQRWDAIHKAMAHP